MHEQDARAREMMPLELLEAEITKLAGNLAAAECRWLLLIAEYDRREGYAEWGCRTCAQWLSWQCGMDLRAGRERVRVARALEELPTVTADFASGKLSYSKVRAITRVATPANEKELVALAAHSTAVHVERAVRAYRSAKSSEQETDNANVRHMARYVRHDWAEDGSLEGRFRIPPEMAAIYLKGIAVAREQVPRDPVEENGPAEHPSEVATTNCDGLIMMAEALLSGIAATSSRGDRFQIVINADAEVLADGGEGVCELDGGPALAPETVRRLACDASIVNLFLEEGGPVAIGEKVPSIPVSTRRAVHARDKGCRFPGCGARAFTNIHHIRHRARRGGNELVNLVELCWFHHRLVHEGGWTVRLDSTGEVLAIRPNGNVLPRPRAAGDHDGHEIERENRELGIKVDPTTCIPRWYGDRLDLDDIVSGLMATEPSA